MTDTSEQLRTSHHFWMGVAFGIAIGIFGSIGFLWMLGSLYGID